MFDEIFGKLGNFWVSDNDKERVPGQINQNDNDFEISFVNVDFNDYDDDYILLNGVVENKKLSLIIINDPIKSTHAKVINNTYYIKYLFEGIHIIIKIILNLRILILKLTIFYQLLTCTHFLQLHQNQIFY